MPQTEWGSQAKALCQQGFCWWSWAHHRNHSYQWQDFLSFAGQQTSGSSSQMLKTDFVLLLWGFPEHKLTADSIIKGRGKGRLVLPEHCLEMWTKAEGIQRILRWNFPSHCHAQWSPGSLSCISHLLPAELCQVSGAPLQVLWVGLGCREFSDFSGDKARCVTAGLWLFNRMCNRNRGLCLLRLWQRMLGKLDRNRRVLVTAGTIKVTSLGFENEELKRFLPFCPPLTMVVLCKSLHFR